MKKMSNKITLNEKIPKEKNPKLKNVEFKDAVFSVVCDPSMNEL